ncbi:MAG: cyclic nucleotide-binding domain-containing protein, partial [Halioglobus sp.]|nr:cyclic nucleotide-binding domain-containing protein [Halioglobus sp.]
PLNTDQESPLYAPPTAQFSVAQAGVLAHNILHRTRGQKLVTFTYKAAGIMASLGGRRGVAEIYGRRVTGIPAWLIWRAAYIGMLPGLAAKTRVALDWFFDLFMPRTIVYMAESDRPATRYLDYSKGEVVQHASEVPAGFYIVLSGSLTQELEKANGETVYHELCVGDSWGSRALKEHRLTHGKITAREDTKLLLVNSGDFQRLRNSYEPFNELLSAGDK